MDNNELLVKFADILDQKLETVLDQKLETVLDQKLETILDQKLETVLDRKFEENLKPIHDRLDGIDERLDKVEERLDGMDTRLRKVEIQMEHEVVPRLQVIENCYLDTFQRYQQGGEDIDALKEDMVIVKKVVAEHSVKLKNIS
ncbi:MAG: hypothetical protein SO445_07885 [Lachnospiraceae bacterium]|nr:hypothetical protein [Lachnospiraceae bacterium]MDY4617612.1 hypothetical protein [Lachnospiraceae bacterium]